MSEISKSCKVRYMIKLQTKHRAKNDWLRLDANFLINIFPRVGYGGVAGASRNKANSASA